MKIKKLISALVLGSMLVGLSGCNITDFSAENLLRPPKAVGDEAEIEQLIAKTADSGYTLKYPKNGKFRSAIIMTDLDGNDSNEAVAFFRNSAETSSVHMLVMYSKDNSWEIASDNIFETTDIDSVDFADLTGNGKAEIILIQQPTLRMSASFPATPTRKARQTKWVRDKAVQALLRGILTMTEQARLCRLFSTQPKTRLLRQCLITTRTAKACMPKQWQTWIRML